MDRHRDPMKRPALQQLGCADALQCRRSDYSLCVPKHLVNVGSFASTGASASVASACDGCAGGGTDRLAADGEVFEGDAVNEAVHSCEVAHQLVDNVGDEVSVVGLTQPFEVAGML